MKRDMKNLNLRDAFPPMPEACRAALMDTARSVKEEEKMKRAALRTVLIVALIVIATTAVAFAAGNIFGWNEFFSAIFTDTRIPQKALEEMRSTQAREFTVGNITFTAQELFCDGRTVMSATEARTADGSDAVIVMDPFAGLNAIGENGKAYAAKLGVSEGMSGIDAARKLGVPLYSVRAILQLEEDQFTGDQMEEALWNEEGSMVYFSLVDSLKPEAIGDTLHAKLFLRVTEYDTETAAELSREKMEADIEIPVSPVLAERDYAPEEALAANGLTLEKVHAVQTAAGVYLETVFTAGEGVEQNAFYELPECDYRTAEGQPYAFGMNLSISYDLDAWPTASMTFLISEDELPEALTFRMGDSTVTLK